MGFRMSGGSSNSSAAGQIVQALSGDLEVWIRLRPGAPAMDIGSNSSVDQYGGFRLDPGMVFHTRLRPGDEIWGRGTDPTTSSEVAAMIRTA